MSFDPQLKLLEIYQKTVELTQDIKKTDGKGVDRLIEKIHQSIETKGGWNDIQGWTQFGVASLTGTASGLSIISNVDGFKQMMQAISQVLPMFSHATSQLVETHKLEPELDANLGINHQLPKKSEQSQKTNQFLETIKGKTDEIMKEYDRAINDTLRA